jgi:hypothetical protein
MVATSFCARMKRFVPGCVPGCVLGQTLLSQGCARCASYFSTYAREREK